MPKMMDPEKFVKAEYVKKREIGHEYFNAEGQRIWAPGWYYYSYRPKKFGPYLNQEAALKAGCEAAIKNRNIP